MSRLLRMTLLAALAALLTACGFHLRGLDAPLKPLPFSRLFLASDNAQVTPPLKALLAVDPRVILVSTPKDAQAILSVVGEQNSKDILTINRGGSINRYQLTYRLTVRVLLDGEEAGPDIEIAVRRELSYNDQDILGKEKEEALLWDDMRQDAARLLLYRLAVLKKAPAMTPVPDASGSHAVVKP
ncbi:LPS-assembly lipoprotein LptE [Paludibacterium paludis]|uniref:LPS-assembly lipoprotein LptE n=1 Tax=Paludibacterium paludis TaxID=1225769 RepID=A0A918UAB4_9NEIS|nr:LPS assembly lipoprotein LptE [Paludibacterium paludis]GGY15948.1 LPS-assembly lipoprotein LptE [Paludibacterium paludis]